MSLRSSSQQPPVIYVKCDRSSRESNPSRRICHLRAVPLGHVADKKNMAAHCFDSIQFNFFLFFLFSAIVDRDHFVFILLLNVAFASWFRAVVLWHWINLIIIINCQLKTQEKLKRLCVWNTFRVY